MRIVLRSATIHCLLLTVHCLLFTVHCLLFTDMNYYVAIMAGGIGSRFWPGSRINRPKQFLDILGVGKSLIQLTYERFLKLCPREHIFIVTNARYKELVKEQLPDLSDGQILCEPSRNNTAPCIAYAAFKLHGLNPNANFVVAPSDHIILDETAFVNTLQQGLTFTATNDALLTLGIQPSRPDTGYGYIRYEADTKNGVHKVLNFTEKPDLPRAQQFLDEGTYLWNAGIFVWKVGSIIKALERHVPAIFKTFDAIRGQLNTPQEQAIVDEVYPTTPKISIDYAIIEKASNVYTIPSNFGWSDLGTWNALHVEAQHRDEHNNVIFGSQVITENTSNCLIRTPDDKLVILKDLDDYIIVDEQDVLLIYPKSKEQEIKAVTKTVAEQNGERFL